MDGVEGVACLDRFAHGLTVDVEIPEQLLREPGQLTHIQVDDEIDIFGRTRNPVEGSRQRAADVIRNPQLLEHLGDLVHDFGMAGAHPPLIRLASCRPARAVSGSLRPRSVAAG